MAKIEIKGVIAQVGIEWSGITTVAIQCLEPKENKRATIIVPCTVEAAKAFGQHLYQPVTVTVEIGNEPDALMSLEMVEALAEYAHNAWSGWMKYLKGKSTINDDGSWTIPESLAKRWQRQMDTGYEDLPEDEKPSDRDEADKIIHTVRLHGSAIGAKSAVMATVMTGEEPEIG